MPKISSYTIQEKCAVIQWCKENGNNLYRTSRHFGIDRKRIREWCQRDQELLSNNYGEKKFLKKMSSGRPVLSEKLDDSLFEFFEKERADGLAVTNHMLSVQALKIAKQLGIQDFKASDRYIMGWKKRFNEGDAFCRSTWNEKDILLSVDTVPKVSTYTVAMKVEVINWHKANGCNISLTSRNFKIDRKCVRDWLSKESELLANNYGVNKCKRRLQCGRRPISEKLDDELFEIFQVERENGRAVTTKFLSEEACKISTRLGIEDFKGTDRYVSNWKKRFHIGLGKATNASEKAVGGGGKKKLLQADSQKRRRRKRLRTDGTESDLTGSQNVAGKTQLHPSNVTRAGGKTGLVQFGSQRKKRLRTESWVTDSEHVTGEMQVHLTETPEMSMAGNATEFILPTCADKNEVMDETTTVVKVEISSPPPSPSLEELLMFSDEFLEISVKEEPLQSSEAEIATSEYILGDTLESSSNCIIKMEPLEDVTS